MVDKHIDRGHGRGVSRGRLLGKVREKSFEQRISFNDHRQNKSHLHCHNCKCFGHLKVVCWFKDKGVYLAQGSEENYLFMACGDSNGAIEDSNEAIGDILLVGSGCSNHMIGTKELLKELDEANKSTMKLGDDNEMHVKERCTMVITTTENKVRILYNVQYVIQFAHNLLSVEQLLSNGYIVTFENMHALLKRGNQVK